MAEIQCIPASQLSLFLDRHRKNETEVLDYDVQVALKKTLDEISEFIPSEGAYVLLDDPLQFFEPGNPKNLIYIAGFGDNAAQLVGLKTISNQGLISQAYSLGSMQTIKAQSGEEIVLDKIHLPKSLKNAVCSPIKTGKTTIGVLALFNRTDPLGYTMRDIRIINILSSYLSLAIQTAIDAKKNKELTKRDNLTGLYNDRYFHSQLEREIFNAERNNTDVILLFIDLDNFKSINDQYGHLVGSQTLKEVGFLLRDVIKSPNATLARYGGDEYVCILPAINLEQALCFANLFREKISEKMFMIDSGSNDGSFISFKGLISASIGISSLQTHTTFEEDLLIRKNELVRKADHAMYKAKEQGKNHVCVSSLTD